MSRKCVLLHFSSFGYNIVCILWTKVCYKMCTKVCNKYVYITKINYNIF